MDEITWKRSTVVERLVKLYSDFNTKLENTIGHRDIVCAKLAQTAYEYYFQKWGD